MDKPLRVLIVEDSDSDVVLEVRALKAAGYQVTYVVAVTAPEMKEALAEQAFDIVISDHDLPEFDAPGALAVLQQSAHDYPFIIVSGVIGEEMAVALMKAGAHDYVMKNKLARLVPAVQRELREAQSRRERRRAEEALNKAKTLLDKTFASIEEAIFIVDSNTRRIVACNQATEVIFGFGEKDLIGCSTDVLHVDKLSYDLFGQELFPALDANGVFRTEFQMRRKDGSVFPTEHTVTEILDDSGHRTSVVSVVRDITDRRMAENKLKQTNIFLDSIIENIPDMIFLKDARDLRFIRFNRAGEDLLGYSREELLGKSDYDFFPKEQADHFTQKDRDVLNGKEVLDIPEESLQTRSKGERTIHTKKVPLLDAKGEPEFLLGISEDITERKKMEETLRERDIRLKKLTSWVPGMIYQFTRRPDGTYYVPFATEAIKDIYGCLPEDVREDFYPIARVILPEDLGKVFGSIEYSAKNLTIWTCEYRVQIPGQSIKWLLGKSTPEKLADGSITWYGFITDITDIKKAEEELRKSEEEFRALAESMPQIVWVTRKDGWNIYFNQQWVDYTGLTLEESYGHGWNTPFHPDDKQKAWDAWQNATKNNDIYSIESRLRRADGVYHWWLIRGVPLLEKTGEIIKWFGTCTDIDNIKLAEKKLLDTIDNLRKSFGATVHVLVSALEMRDPYTAGHQLRVADLARTIATEMGLSHQKIEGLRMAGSIHDIGKLSIPSEILSKPSKLTDLEFSLIKEHSQTGYNILKDVESPWPLAQIIYQHHERMDGSGYPRNLKGDEILMEARIMAVSDVVESMASHRPYRAAIGIEAALEEIEKNKGMLYDDAVVDACLRLFREKGFQLQKA
jgi:PAS domain S-box-containing protein